MNCRLILICASLALITLTCSKEDHFAIVNGKIYLKQSIQAVGAFRVFERNGEVKGAFISQEHKDELSYQRDLLIQNFLSNHYIDSLIFTNNSSATLSHFGIDYNYDVGADQSHLILTAKDISDHHSTNTICAENFEHRIKHAPHEILSTELISSVGGYYVFQCKINQRYLFNTSTSELTLPIYIYLLRNYTSNSTMPGTLYNELKADFYKELKSDEQLITQKLNVIYQ